MGTWNHLWHFIFFLFLCTEVVLTEGTKVTTATPQTHINGSVSTEPDGRTVSAAHSSGAIAAEPSTTTTHSLLDTSFLSPSTMRMVAGEERTETDPTMPNGDWSSPGVSARSDGVSPAIPTGSDITVTSMVMVSGGASSMPLGPSSAVTRHSSSSLDSLTAVTPSPQQSSTSITTEEHLATTSHTPTVLMLSSLSTAGITSALLVAVTAEDMTHSPTSPRPVDSTSGISRATDTIEASHSPTLGVSTEISADRPTSTPSTQGQAMVEAGTTSSSMGSPSPGTASVTTHATTPPGDSPTVSQGGQTSTESNVKTAHSLPATSLVSLPMVDGEGRTETTTMMPTGEGSSPGVTARSDGMSPAIPTGSGTTAISMGMVSGSDYSLPVSPSSAVTSHSLSSPDDSPAVTPSPQQSSTSITTEEHLATTSHAPTALMLSSLSTAGITSMPLAAGTAEDMIHNPTSPRPVDSTSGISRAADTIEASHSPTLGVSMEISASRPTSTSSTQGQAMVEAGTTSSSMGSPSPGTASVTTHATTLPGDTPTVSHGGQTSTEPSVKTAHSLPATSLVSLPMVDGEGRTETTPTRPTWEGSSPRTSIGSDGVSPAIPTGSDITVTSMVTVSGSHSSLPLSPSSAVTSHSSSSSDDSPAVTPSPQQSSTSITTEEHLATTSHTPTVLMLSSLSTAGITSALLAAGTAEDMTHNPTSPRPVDSTSGISHATDTIEASHSPTLGVSTEISAARPTSTPSTQGQAMVEAGTTSSSMGSPSPGTASVTTHATTLPGDSPTVSHGGQTSTESNVKTAHSLPATSLVSLPMVDGEGRTETTTMMPTGEGSSPGVSARSDGMSPAIPTGSGTTAISMATVSGSDYSLPVSPSSAVTSHSLSSPDDSPAVTPSPQQSSTSITTEEHLATTSHASTALMLSSLSTAGITSALLAAVTAEDMTHSPTSPRPVASTSGISRATDTIEASHSPTLGVSTEISATQPTSTPSTQGQAVVEAGTTSSSMGSPSPGTASVTTHATTPPGDTPTVSHGGQTSTESNVKTAHSLLATSLVSFPMVDGEGRTETTPTRPTWEGSSPRTSIGSDGVSPVTPTASDITAISMGTVSGSDSSLPVSPSSAVTSHFSSSSDDSPAVTPSPQQSSTSITTEEHLATTSHTPTALMLSSLSTAGITSALLAAVTAEDVTRSPAPSTNSTNPEVSISSPSPTSGITKASLSSTLGSNTETSAAQPTSAPATVEPGTTLTSVGSPLPSTTMTSIAMSATTPPGEGESPTTNQGSGTTANPSAEPSHSFPVTTLATPSTTNFSISTSLNPSVTGTCSPITLSIQLENVTSTMIQFSWKPQGGTADSPYTVSLRGESGEMEKRILNETSTAFENLISGHQYQISVDVSSCSKNVSTSLTIQTAAEVYSGTTRITNKEFKPEYQNKSSREFQEFETKFIEEITKHLPQEIQELKNGTKMRVVINSLENGSVIVLFDVVLDVGHNLPQPEISDAFTEALNMSTEFHIDPQKTFIEARNSCQPELNDCSQYAACTAEGATYSCQCNEGFTDKSPQVPGRVCQQDLPSQQTTTVPPQNETTGFTELTTTVPPQNETTRYTELTTTVSPENETTGITELTTTVSPENETTGITELTTPVAPQNETTGITELTTTVPPQNHTTGVTEHTTPSPPQNHTTGFTGSASTSIFTTTFTSAPCMPLSIEVQSVTGEEIQLSWTGGSTDSLYNIFIMDGNPEIRTMTTKETEAVLKDLLPGHVYNISVAVSSCAGNNWTSVTVRTDPVSCFNRAEFCLPENTGCSDLKDIVCSDNQAFACSVRFKNQTFNKTLYNSESEDYKAMAESIKKDVVRGMRIELNDDRFDIVVLGFRPGSVVVDFISLLPKEEPIDVNVIQTHLSQVLQRKFGDQIQVTVKSLSDQSSTDNSYSWRVAVIVLGVLLGVALVLILLAILFFIYMKKKSGKYLVEPTGLMGNFVYKHL